MKALKITSGVLGSILSAAAVAAIVLTIWANKPRNVKIDISKINY
jgi:hypothetical protein